MNKFSMLLVNNNRSKAYLQNLVSEGLIPSNIIVLSDANIKLPEHTENDRQIKGNTSQKFIRKAKDVKLSLDEKEHVLTTIKKYKIPHVICETLDVNSSLVVNEVRRDESEYIVYSGPSGTILRKDILSQGKKFIHVHPGWLPEFRGSTTIYYSMLVNLEVGASVILFEEGIDEGPILYRKKYHITDSAIDFDYVLDPLVRARTLIDFFKSDSFLPVQQNNFDTSCTFYIVHPLLKHASINKSRNSCNQPDISS